ncbi:MAG: DUF3137 domain-containing protein [Planctomycetes bacterium]|nr:DUF3137 domain-containing protein [Planctomycetota bacterium]MBI3846723.1 DUF3137 domain-containing protein [Planctomycetota bacterium]
MTILRKLFGPSRDEVWRDLSRQIGAEFVDGRWWQRSRVEAHVGEWTVTLDVFVVSTGKSSHPFTRLRAPYVNRDGFRFEIYRKTIFSGLGKRFGMQDIEVGDSELDDAFIFKGNDEAKVRTLLQSAQIRQLLRAQPAVHFQVKDDEGWFGPQFPEGVDELHFQIHGIVKDVNRLKGMFDLFAETLHQLCVMGSAYEKDPGVRNR